MVNIESPFHYYDNTGPKLYKVQTRERLLKKAGLNVLTLCYKDFRQDGTRVLKKEKIMEAVEEAIQSKTRGREPKNLFYEIAMEK